MKSLFELMEGPKNIKLFSFRGFIKILIAQLNETTIMIVWYDAKFSLLYISTNIVAILQPHPNKSTCSATDPYTKIL